MSQSAGKMLEKFGLKHLKSIHLDFAQKSSQEIILLCSQERDKLDEAIKWFRENNKTPSKFEHRYFNNLKEERKKLQHEVRKLRRFERRKKEKELHEKLSVMTKEELKDWRVLSHKLYNIERNFESIQEGINNLEYSKFEVLRSNLKEETNKLNLHINSYKEIMQQIQNVVTKEYYKDLNIVNQYKASTTPEAICQTSKEDEDMVQS